LREIDLSSTSTALLVSDGLASLRFFFMAKPISTTNLACLAALLGLITVSAGCLRSEAAWNQLAERAAKTEQLRVAHEAAKAAALEISTTN